MIFYNTYTIFTYKPVFCDKYQNKSYPHIVRKFGQENFWNNFAIRFFT
jgi:predicted helicase